MENFIKSFTDWTFDDWAGPSYKASELAVSTTDLFTYCQTTNFAKQFAIRANSLGGFFDLLATIGVAFFKEWRDEGSSDNKLYIAMIGAKDSEPCNEFANFCGQIL